MVERTLREPPGAVTHWTGRAMAKAIGLSLRTIQRIWAAHKLQPHRIRTFKRSNDPDFAAKLDDVVGLIHEPAPTRGGGLHRREKARSRRSTGPSRVFSAEAGEMRNPHARLQTPPRGARRPCSPPLSSVLEGKVIGRCVPRHRHRGVHPLHRNLVERSVPAVARVDPRHPRQLCKRRHKHPRVLAWLAEHPRWTFHFTPTSCSWLNAVEGFFSKLTRQSLKRGVFRSVDDLENAITRYIAATNRHPKPFVCTATAKTIQAKLKLNHPSESVR